MIPLIQYHTPKFYYLKKLYKNRPFTLLDIGSGNHSASKTKKLFPACEYHGVDLEQDFNNDEADFAAMDAFYQMDLTLLDFKVIPDSYFDFIRIAHVIEHLYNGDQVIELLLPKLKPGGHIYIEYPGAKSTKLPSMEGTLNFYDDPTHVRIYSVKELDELLRSNKMHILRSGTRRNPAFLLATPFRIAGQWLKGNKVQGNMLWDLLGFAEFIYARKIA